MDENSLKATEGFSRSSVNSWGDSLVSLELLGAVCVRFEEFPPHWNTDLVYPQHLRVVTWPLEWSCHNNGIPVGLARVLNAQVEGLKCVGEF